ncbi:Putative lipid phosphate phosphatase 3, chloroplastic [Linum perenne]
MREVDLGAHTIKSHGAGIAKIHMYDWLILLLLGAIEVTLYIIHPFYRFIYAVLLPILVFIVFYFRRRCVYDLHHAILGLLFSVLVTAVLTDAIKDAVGRPRPDFFWRCFPDGKDVYDQWGDVICHGSVDDIKEGHKSFPSGHASWSFAGLGFLSLYLSGKIKVFDRQGHVAKLCIVILPLLVACLVAISRVNDYWHHWQDVFAGSLLGLVISGFCYRQFFPSPYHDQGWGPYAYFLALEEESRSGDPNARTNNEPAMEVRQHQALRPTNGDLQFTSIDLESGGR